MAIAGPLGAGKVFSSHRAPPPQKQPSENYAPAVGPLAKAFTTADWSRPPVACGRLSVSICVVLAVMDLSYFYQAQSCTLGRAALVVTVGSEVPVAEPSSLQESTYSQLTKCFPSTPTGCVPKDIKDSQADLMVGGWETLNPCGTLS